MKKKSKIKSHYFLVMNQITICLIANTNVFFGHCNVNFCARKIAKFCWQGCQDLMNVSAQN